MSADLGSPSRRSTPRWAGRASRHRREQVHGRVADADAGVLPLWESLVEVLRSLDAPSSALLCTAVGAPVAAYGLPPRTDLPLASRRTGRMFADRAPRGGGARGTVSDVVETVEVTLGLRHTVIASVPAHPQGDHLLCVSAEGVSPPLLQAWTRRAAEDLSEVLADQGSPSSSSAAP